MKIQKAIVTGIAAAVLVLAAGCKSTSGTTTTTTSSYGGSSMTSSSTLDTGTTSDINNTTGTTTDTTVQTAPSTTTYSTSSSTAPAGTTVVDNGNGTQTVTQTTVTTYPNGTTTVSSTPSGSSSMASSSTLTTPTTTDVNNANGTTNTTVTNGATVTTRTVTTTNSTRSLAPVSMASSSTTTTAAPCAPVTTYPAMTSSSQTIYTPGYTTTSRGRSGRGLDFLLFADRASFSNSNTALNGTLTTGNLRTDIDRENGYGLGLNAYWTPNFSTEFTASRIRPRTTFTPASTEFNPITGMRVRMTPITGTLQLHFAPHKGIDPYIGAGVAYVMFDNESGSFNAGNTGLTSVNFRDEWGPLANAGLNFGLSHGFGIVVDAKYMWVRARAETTFDNVTIGNVGNNTRLGLNPFLLSAGIRFGF